MRSCRFYNSYFINLNPIASLNPRWAKPSFVFSGFPRLEVGKFTPPLQQNIRIRMNYFAAFINIIQSYNTPIFNWNTRIFNNKRDSRNQPNLEEKGRPSRRIHLNSKRMTINGTARYSGKWPYATKRKNGYRNQVDSY